MTISKHKILAGLPKFAVGFLGIVARFAVLFPVILCLYDYLAAAWMCVELFSFRDFRLDMLGCPVVMVLFSFVSIIEPHVDSEGVLLPHYLPLSLVALAIAIMWAIIDHRRYGKGRH